MDWEKLKRVVCADMFGPPVKMIDVSFECKFCPKCKAPWSGPGGTFVLNTCTKCGFSFDGKVITMKDGEVV